MSTNHGFMEWAKQNSSFIQLLSTLVTTAVVFFTFIGTVLGNIARWTRAIVRFFRNKPREGEQIDRKDIKVRKHRK